MPTETASIEDLKKLCDKALVKAGLRQKDVELIIDHFLENEISGKASHGLVRVVEAAHAVKKYGIPDKDPEVERDTGSMVTVNANRQTGPVAGHYALQTAITRAKEHGLALVGVHDYIASSGSMAYYLRRLGEENLVGLMGCNSVAQVAPPGGCERVIGTNPVGIAIPGENGEALIADLATSAIAYGKIMVMKDKGEAVPEGLLVDKNGRPSTDPADAYEGAILPLAGYKGFGLGLMVELLAGPLIGAKAIKKDLYDNDGLFIIAIDPVKTGGDMFFKEISAAFEQIKQSKTNGPGPIALPGERSGAVLEETIKKGQIEVATGTLKKLRKLAT